MRSKDLATGSAPHYQSSVEQSTQGVGRFEPEGPVPTDLTPDEQVECFYHQGYVAKRNDDMARTSSCTRPQEILSPADRTLEVSRAWGKPWGVTLLQDLAGYNLLEDQQPAAKGVTLCLQRAFFGEPTLIPPIRYDHPEETVPSLIGREEPKHPPKAYIYPAKDAVGNVCEV